MKPISVNDKVICKFYNSMDRKFYGSSFEAIILKTRDKTNEKPFLIKHPDSGMKLWIHRKEILRRVK